MTLLPGGAPANMASGLRNFARATPTAIATIDQGRTVTFIELDERARRLAAHLRSVDLREGDRVAVLLGNCSEYLEIAAALARARLVMVPVNPKLTSSEQRWIVGHAGCRAIIVDESIAPSTGVPHVDHVLSVNGTDLGVDYEEALASASSADVWDPAPETDTFAVYYTSGTTGRPKGVMVSHRSRTLNFYHAALEWRLGPGRQTLAVAPMYHGAGFSFAMSGIYTGSTVAILRSWSADGFTEAVEQHRPQSLFLVPTHAQMLRDLGDDAVVRQRLSSLDTLFFNAAALPVPLKTWVHELLPGVGVHELYGSTEAGVISNLRPDDSLRKPGSVGPPWFLTEAKLRTSDGKWIEGPGRGELFTRSPFLMNGYLDAPEATEECTTTDGFLTSGDVVEVDDDGYLFVVDRVKDVIISGGVNIYPREVEDVLRRHALVRDIAIVGTPDERWGETVTAVVVFGGELNDGDAAARNQAFADLDAFCRDELASFKVPRGWHVRPELPRNAAGKVLKRELREQINDEPIH
jgi:long-chain acyl-CoA synthetase